VGRVGLLAAATMWFYRFVFSFVPLPFQATAPYFMTTAIVFTIMIGIAAYAMRTSVGTRPLFSAARLDE
jgi:hypothetical protein